MSKTGKNNLDQDLATSAANPKLGVYPQKQNGLYMQRIKIFAGQISWLQWRTVVNLAIKYTPGSPLHLTTRQDIELHNILPENICDLHDRLAEVSLPIFGAGGDSIRNITVCPGCEFCHDGFDLTPIAWVVRQHLEKQALIFDLPRKFKISFSSCQNACVKPYLNDLGFVMQKNGLFTAIGAGSLGPKPNLGIELYKDLPAEDILPLCAAAVEFFNEHGDRKNRRRARFRHVREKFGNDAFKTELGERFRTLKDQKSWPNITPAPGKKNFKRLHRLQLPNGDISPGAAIELAQIAEANQALLRLNLEHGLEIYGQKDFPLTEELAAFKNNPIIIACPGSSTCPKAFADTKQTANAIRQALIGQEQTDVRINISGCPNSCAHSTAADIGLVGILRKENNHQRKCYRLYTNGGNGKNDKLGKMVDTIFEENAPDAVKNILRDNAQGPSD